MQKRNYKMKTNIKMRVTPEQSAKVQEIVFARGGEWRGGDMGIQLTENPLLFFKETCLTYMTDEIKYSKRLEEEVDPELFIRTNGTCEEDRLCGAEELKTIKEVLQDFQGTYPKQYDPVNPTHYQIGGVETIDFIEAKLTPEEFKGYCKGNAIKYLSRAGYKGEERDDYKKAAWYLDKLINK